MPGTSYKGKFCGQCRPDQAWVNWSAGKTATFIILLAAGFLAIVVFVFLGPLIPALDVRSLCRRQRR